MVSSELEVFNLALSAIGTRSNISGPTDGREGEVCALWYPQVRDQVLRSAPWSSARASARLAVYRERDFGLEWAVTDPEATWTYAYTAPVDMVMPRYSSSYSRFVLAEMDGAMRIMSNEENMILHYTKRQTNVAMWDQGLALAVIQGLAATIAMPLHAKSGRAKDAYGLAREAILDARVQNANEDTFEIEAMPEWLTARGIGASGYPNRYVHPVGPMLGTPDV